MSAAAGCKRKDAPDEQSLQIAIQHMHLRASRPSCAPIRTSFPVACVARTAWNVQATDGLSATHNKEGLASLRDLRLISALCALCLAYSGTVPTKPWLCPAASTYHPQMT